MEAARDLFMEREYDQVSTAEVLERSGVSRGALYHLLQNHVYRGEVVHQGISYPGEQERIVDEELWSAVLTRKGGSYALIARMPPDPSVN